MAGSTLSLVMIAKDEAELVATVLSDHVGLFDEAVVVDTGSIDGTAAAAEAGGARVVRFRWCDDFAAARNVGLQRARGDWIVVLDADEAIAAEDFPTIRNAMAQQRRACHHFPQWNYTTATTHPEWQQVQGRYPRWEEGQTGYVVAFNIRLFPNLPQLHYEGCIHESVEAAAGRIGLPLSLLDVPIHHFGHVRSGAVRDRRDSLYGRLVRRKWRQNRDDAATCLEMACRLVEECRPGDAELMFRAIADAADRHGAQPGARAGLWLGRLLRQRGELQEAERELRRAMQLKPDWLALWLEMIRILARGEQWSQMELHLHQAKGLFGAVPQLVEQEFRLLVATGRREPARRLAVAQTAGCDQGRGRRQ